MDLDRGVVVDALRTAGYPEAADEVLRTFPEQRVDRDEVLAVVARYGISSLDSLISRMGGSS